MTTFETVSPWAAINTLTELGFVLAETTKRGGQKWVLPIQGHELFIPGPGGIQAIPVAFLDKARHSALMLSLKGLPVLAEEPK